MTTLVDFAPSTTAPFQFQPTLDNVQYTVIVTWNIFGERYYINVLDLANNLIVCRSLAESGPTFRVSLTWDDNVATAVTNAPHNVPIASLVNLRILDSDTGFDGTYQGFAIDENTLTFELDVNPNEPVAVPGTLSFDLDLLGGYGIGSLYFHEDTQQFEF